MSKDVQNLFLNRKNFDGSVIPESVRNLPPTSSDPEALSPWNKTGYASYNAPIAAAIYQFLRGPASSIALVQIDDGGTCFSMEQTDANTNSTIIAYANKTGSLQAVKATAGTAGKIRYESLEPLGSRSDDLDTTGILLMYVFLACSADPSVADAWDKLCQSSAAGAPDAHSVYKICDAVSSGLTSEEIKSKITSGNIDTLSKERIELGGLSGVLLCGSSKYIMPQASVTASRPATVKDAKALNAVQEFRKEHVWTPEQLTHVPEFPEDAAVSNECWKIIYKMLSSRKLKTKVCNFEIRGVTGLGKTTSTKMAASILGMPYYTVVCQADSDLNDDFYGKYTPVPPPEIDLSALPTIESLYLDPEGSYAEITGNWKAGVTPAEVQNAYNNKVKEAAAAIGNGPFLKFIESPYITAMRDGGILEIQEFDTPRKAGVLKGLVDHDLPGASIRLPNGESIRRNVDTITVWTANIGYASSREVDKAVIRRQPVHIYAKEIERDEVIGRVLYNIDNRLSREIVEKLYDCFIEIQDSCMKESYTDEPFPITGLQAWALDLANNGFDNIQESFMESCINSMVCSDVQTLSLIEKGIVEIKIAAMSI